MKTKSRRNQNALSSNMNFKSGKKIQREKAYDFFCETAVVLHNSSYTLSELTTYKKSVSDLFDNATSLIKAQHPKDRLGSLSSSAISKASDFFDCFYPLPDHFYDDEYTRRYIHVLECSTEKYLTLLECAFLCMPLTMMIFLLDSKINEVISQSPNGYHKTHI